MRGEHCLQHRIDKTDGMALRLPHQRDSDGGIPYQHHPQCDQSHQQPQGDAVGNRVSGQHARNQRRYARHAAHRQCAPVGNRLSRSKKGEGRRCSFFACCHELGLSVLLLVLRLLQ
ncbi:hypothetical protein D3C72_1456010 [compost metagenome]